MTPAKLLTKIRQAFPAADPTEVVDRAWRAEGMA
jgi:hypothetical protein